MTDEDLKQRFSQLADAVSRVAEASTTGMQQLSTKMEQLTEGQLALQRLGGQLSQVVLEIRAEIQQLKAGQEQHQAMMMELLRQRHSPE